jgi:O-antigen ligase/polysaccharide polymerase Wzy-like membrane protein
MLRLVLVPLVIGLAVSLIALQDGGASGGTRQVAAMLVWWGILIAVAFSLAPVAPVPRAATACAALLLGFAAFAGLSATWAPSAERAFGELGRVLLYGGVLLAPILLSRRGDAGRWADGLAGAVAAVGILALSQRLFPDLLPSDDLAAQLPTAATRLTYPLGYWNGLAILLGLGVPLLLRSAVVARSPLWRAAALAPLPVLGAGIYLTSSRGGAAVAIVSAVVFVVLCRRRLHAVIALALGALASVAAIAVLAARPALVDGPFDSATARDAGTEAALLIAGICLLAGIVYALLATRAPARLPIPVAGWVVLALGAVAALVAADPVARLRTFKAVPPDQGGGAVAISGHLTSGGGSGRWQFWSAALDQFSAHPLAGGGAGSYEPYWAQHGSLDWFVRNAHSLWLETLGELGLIGFALVAGAFAIGLVVGIGRLREGTDAERTTVAALLAVLAGFVLGGAIDWIWQLPVVPIVALLGLGLLVGPATLPRAAAEPTANPEPARLGFGARAGAVLLGWVALMAIAIPFLASQEVDASQRAATRGDLGEALKRARSAQAIQPWAASPRQQLALVEEEAGRLDLARRDIAGAIERDSSDWRLHVIASRLAVKSGDIPAARRELALARGLNPRSRLLRTP